MFNLLEVSANVGESKLKCKNEIYISFPFNLVKHIPPAVLDNNCVLVFRLQRDPAAPDDGTVEVSLGAARGAGGLLPAAQQYTGGAVQE